MYSKVIEIETDDGICPAHFFSSSDNVQCPCVLFYMDAGGIRPTVLDMAKRLATNGYNVLLPDLYYRFGDYGPFVPKEVLAGDLQSTLGPLMATTGNAKCAADTSNFLSALDEELRTSNNKVGAVGFCMGAGMAIASAATSPDRIIAVASFHGGNLATGEPDSPHRYAASLNAELYIAAASDDPSYPTDMSERFESALEAENVSFTAETYPASHGWMKPDFPVYDERAAERGWQSMIAFFERTLR